MSPKRRRQRPLWMPLGGIVLIAVGLFAGVFTAGWAPKLGLDLAGGAYVVFTPTHKTSADKIQEAADIVTDRIGTQLPNSSPQVQVEGQDIVVQIAGVKNPQALVSYIGQTGQVEFRPMACAEPTTYENQSIYEGIPIAPYAPQGAKKFTAKPKSGTSTKKPAKSSTKSTSTTAATTTTAAKAATTTTAAKAATTTTAAKAARSVHPGSSLSQRAERAAASGGSAPASTSGSAPAASSSAPASASGGSTPAASSASSITPTELNSICSNETSSTSSQPSTSELEAISEEVPSTQVSLGGTPPQYVLYPAPILTNGKQPYERYLLGPLGANGTIIKTATAGVVSGVAGWVVDFTLTSKGSNTWNSIAQANFHKPVAIAVSGQVVSAPVIDETQSTFSSFNGQGEISGDLTETQAQEVAQVMRYGALPVVLKQQTVETVSPSLGKSSLRAGLLAGLLGMALVMIYTILYYRALGVVVVAGLGLTALLLWSITSILSHTTGETLDLSGVTGVIVSIGVTVDSYIVYFERLKDDVRQGKTIRSSVDKGFRRAYRTVLAADAVSMIGAIVLYFFAVGPVRGFAFFLGLSTLLDVFATYFFTRPMVVLLGRSRAFTEARWIGVARGLTPQPVGDESERDEPTGGDSAGGEFAMVGEDG